MFSKACEYAIKASIFIAQKSLHHSTTNVKEVAEAIDAPVAFTAKTLQQLCKANILISTRGKQGGFQILSEKMKEIRIYDIVKEIDGEGIFTACVLGLHQCSPSNPCPVHNDYKNIRSHLITVFKTFSLYELALKTENGIAWLKN